jgi:hypothetical protein
MKHLLLTTIVAVLLVGCGKSQPTEPPIAKAPDMSIHFAAWSGNIKAVKQHLTAGTDVDAKNEWRATALLKAAREGHKEISELLIKVYHIPKDIFISSKKEQYGLWSLL